jgi:hypothetical protein
MTRRADKTSQTLGKLRKQAAVRHLAQVLGVAWTLNLRDMTSHGSLYHNTHLGPLFLLSHIKSHNFQSISCSFIVRLIVSEVSVGARPC